MTNPTTAIPTSHATRTPDRLPGCLSRFLWISRMLLSMPLTVWQATNPPLTAEPALRKRLRGDHEQDAPRRRQVLRNQVDVVAARRHQVAVAEIHLHLLQRPSVIDVLRHGVQAARRAGRRCR